MKKLVLSVVVAAFALAVQAGGDDGCCAQSAGSCCAAKKASMEAKAECPMAQQAKNGQKNALAKQASVKKPLKSPKATG